MHSLYQSNYQRTFQLFINVFTCTQKWGINLLGGGGVLSFQRAVWQCNYVRQSTVEEGGGCPASHRWVLGGHSQWRAPPLTERAIGRPHALGICVNSLMRWQTLPSRPPLQSSRNWCRRSRSPYFLCGVLSFSAGRAPPTPTSSRTSLWSHKASLKKTKRTFIL